MVVSSSEHPIPEAALLAETAWLRRLARHMVGEEEADDVVQDACVKALERPPKDPSGLRGWLAQVVRNAARGRFRDRLRRLRREALAARGEAAPFRIEGLPSGTYFVTTGLRNSTYVYEAWRDTRNRGPSGTRVESGTLDTVLTLK